MSELTDRIYARCIEVGECLEWQGPVQKGGGMYISEGAKKYLVRRVLWREEHGNIPEGRLISVSCCNPRCVCHLQAISVSQRNKKIAKSGAFKSIAFRAKIANACRKNSKLSDAAVAEIRAAEIAPAEAAEKFGITESYVNMLRAGRFRIDFSSPFAGLGTRT